MQIVLRNYHCLCPALEAASGFSCFVFVLILWEGHYSPHMTARKLRLSEANSAKVVQLVTGRARMKPRPPAPKSFLTTDIISVKARECWQGWPMSGTLWLPLCHSQVHWDSYSHDFTRFLLQHSVTGKERSWCFEPKALPESGIQASHLYFQDLKSVLLQNIVKLAQTSFTFKTKRQEASVEKCFGEIIVRHLTGLSLCDNPRQAFQSLPGIWFPLRLNPDVWSGDNIPWGTEGKGVSERSLSCIPHIGNINNWKI